MQLLDLLVLRRNSLTVQLPAWLVVCTQESRFTVQLLSNGFYEGVQFYSVTKKAGGFMQEFSFKVQLPDWWYVRRSPVLQSNYLIGGLHAGVQFYN